MGDDRSGLDECGAFVRLKGLGRNDERNERERERWYLSQIEEAEEGLVGPKVFW